MKSTITQREDALPPTYPCLVKAEDGTIVLLSDNEVGTVVHPGPYNEVGQYSTTWYMPNFKPFTGVITLEG
ncbi:hypothetical protein [Bradyrhizobium sp. USDA 4350]